ncbi:MAG: hypothetical protein DHS20C15_14080 [Planctomycetota bacterium]|nr:MAG: hypothetical protein DHS20C15_14080 [Planctomycetota bacterium]
MNHDMQRERSERRARQWAGRAHEQLHAIRERLHARYQRHLEERCDPREAATVLDQLTARRLLPLGGGLRQASAHHASDGLSASTRAFLQLSRADREVLWPLRGGATAYGALPGGSPLLRSARRAALRRLAENFSACRAAFHEGDSTSRSAGVGGLS